VASEAEGTWARIGWSLLAALAPDDVDLALLASGGTAALVDGPLPFGDLYLGATMVVVGGRRIAHVARAAGDAAEVVLNLGSGRRPKPGAINLDVMPAKGVDVVADARNLPLRSESIDKVVADALPSMVGANPRTAIEAFRVLRPGGTVMLHSNTQFGPSAIDSFRAAGFLDVRLGPGNQVLHATKP
jgi:hypothetical protein